MAAEQTGEGGSRREDGDADSGHGELIRQCREALGSDEHPERLAGLLGRLREALDGEIAQIDRALSREASEIYAEYEEPRHT